MSFIAERMPGDLERALWLTSEHSGKIVADLDELKELFSGTIDGEIELVGATRYAKIYGVKGHFPPKIAYDHVKGCGEIVVGPPKIEDDISMRTAPPLSGREGYDVYCTSCEVQLQPFTGKIS